MHTAHILSYHCGPKLPGTEHSGKPAAQRKKEGSTGSLSLLWDQGNVLLRTHSLALTIVAIPPSAATRVVRQWSPRPGLSHATRASLLPSIAHRLSFLQLYSQTSLVSGTPFPQAGFLGSSEMADSIWDFFSINSPLGMFLTRWFAFP